MYATMFLMLFLLFIPKTLKNSGIKMMIDGKKEGMFMFMFSKVLWATLVMAIASIWFEGLIFNVVGLYVVGAFVIKLYQERRYFEIVLRKKAILK